MELAEAVALEEAQQLSTLVQELHAEKAEMTMSLQKMERERRYLAEENALLRSQLPSSATPEPGAADGNLSPTPGALRELPLDDEDQARLLQLEHDNILLRARIAALEKANLAQQTALVGAIEEGERSRIVEALYKSPRRSPRGVHSPLHWRSEVTEGSEVASSGVETSSARDEARRLLVARSLGSEFGEC